MAQNNQIEPTQRCHIARKPLKFEQLWLGYKTAAVPHAKTHAVPGLVRSSFKAYALTINQNCVEEEEAHSAYYASNWKWIVLTQPNNKVYSWIYWIYWCPHAHDAFPTLAKLRADHISSNTPFPRRRQLSLFIPYGNWVSKTPPPNRRHIDNPCCLCWQPSSLTQSACT